jgi:hypothetical protein
MIEVYKISFDANHCRSLALTDNSFLTDGKLIFDGRPKLPGWAPPPFWIYDPLLLDSDFQGGPGGCLTFPERLTKNDRVMECLEMSGEILQINLETGEKYFILNVTKCINALDSSKCKFSSYWDIESQSSKRGGLRKYSFHPDRIASTPIFKIPETARAHVLTSRNTNRLLCPDDFMTVYEEEKLTGLIFERVWAEGEDE